MKDNFYRVFEDKYRGTREFIKTRLKVYLPFILPLKETYPNTTAFDIGCGRGEWLELLAENDIDAQGIDIDEGMLASCLDLGLNVTHGDGINMLQEQADESFMIISAFHVVEHISFNQMQTLVNEALRVLKPGGLLILETPNPENIKVATESFYLDPTHKSPIPSALLSFITEYHGFKRTKLLRLHEPKGISDQLFASLGQVIEGISPDYAVIAQKDASNEILSLFEEPFSKKIGLSLSDLSSKFEIRMLHFETEISRALNRADEAKQQADEARQQANEARQQANEAWHHYYSVTTSASWRVTKPLRIFKKRLKWFVQGVTAWITFSPHSRPRRTLRKIFHSLKQMVHSHATLKVVITKILNNFPGLKTMLQKIELKHDLPTENNIEKLSPRATQIYTDLKNNQDNKKVTQECES